MDDDMHVYDVAGYQGRGHIRLSDKAERVTCFNDKQEYMSLHGPQKEGSNEYQEPQWCARNTRAAVTNDEVIGSLNSHMQKDELKQMKRCLCVLTLLVVILFLVTISSLGLAAYGFNSITTLDTHINDTNVQVVTLVSLQSAVNMIESRVNMTSIEVASLISTVNTSESRLTTINAKVVSQIVDLESRFNTTNTEVISQRTLTDTLESRFNAINAEVSSQRTLVNTLNSRLNGIEVSTLPSVRSSVTSLQSQLNMTSTTMSSLQNALRSQPIIRLSQVTIRTTGNTFIASFVKLDSVTFNEQGSKVNISTSSNVNAVDDGNGNILSYRPNYQDVFRSNLATIFIHMQAVYPCVTNHRQISCTLLPNEEDGFRGGRAIFEAMEYGGGFGVFSGITYAFAIEGCSQLNFACYSSTYSLDFTLMCLIPSSVCS